MACWPSNHPIRKIFFQFFLSQSSIRWDSYRNSFLFFLEGDKKSMLSRTTFEAIDRARHSNDSRSAASNWFSCWKTQPEKLISIFSPSLLYLASDFVLDMVPFESPIFHFISINSSFLFIIPPCLTVHVKNKKVPTSSDTLFINVFWSRTHRK